MASLASATNVRMKQSEAFWSASAGLAAYYRSRVTQFPGRQVQGRSDEFVRKAERWRVRSARYLKLYGNLSKHFDHVTVDPRLSRIVVDLMEGVAPRLQAAFDAHLGKLALNALREWPVMTGLSQSLLSLEYEVSDGGDTFTGRVRSRAGYTVFIAGQPHRHLIDRPGGEAADRIASDALDEIARMGG